MGWHAQLDLAYERSPAGRTLARFRHSGPLRVMQSLYPEGDATCHNVLVHPPGGVVDGDVLDIRVRAGAGTHGLITTPGATRFYRCDHGTGRQRVHLHVETGARLEWLPLETLCYSGCDASNHLSMTLDDGAELIGWDVTALGLPAAGLPFVRGRLEQHLELAGSWLERGCIDACDARLMQGPLGLAGQTCLGTLFLAAGADLPRERRTQAIEALLPLLQDDAALQACAGVTAPGPRVVVLRVLAPQVEPAMVLLRKAWSAWRTRLWGLAATPPRGWAV